MIGVYLIDMVTIISNGLLLGAIARHILLNSILQGDSWILKLLPRPIKSSLRPLLPRKTTLKFINLILLHAGGRRILLVDGVLEVGLGRRVVVVDEGVLGGWPLSPFLWKVCGFWSCLAVKGLSRLGAIFVDTPLTLVSAVIQTMYQLVTEAWCVRLNAAVTSDLLVSLIILTQWIPSLSHQTFNRCGKSVPRHSILGCFESFSREWCRRPIRVGCDILSHFILFKDRLIGRNKNFNLL